VTVGHLRCWPSEPKWQELEQGEELRARRVNFEQVLNPLGLKTMVLEAGEDFDELVLGIPVGALPPLCEELAAANSRFKDMLEHSDTVMTEGIQLWLMHRATELGWPYEPAIATSYVTRADTYSNMSQLLPREAWPSGQAACSSTRASATRRTQTPGCAKTPTGSSSTTSCPCGRGPPPPPQEG
jgi:hypothetical protein